MLSVTSTSKRSGAWTSCMAALSTSMCSNSTSGYSAATSVDHATPHARRLEHVRLVDRRDVTAAGARQLEGPAHDPLDLARVVLAGVEHGAVVADTPGAEVDAADELAQEQQVDAVLPRRTEVRVDVELGAQAHDALLRADVRGVEVRVPDRRLEDGGRLPACLQRVGRERIAVLADGLAAERPLVDLQIGRQDEQRPPGLRA